MALEVVEEENYYAFGMKHQGYNNVTSSNANNVAQKIEFNGKEYQDELSLNWYDYGARNYDPTVGRWFNVDPLAEKYRRWTPYNYCMNNPVYFIDPDGMSVNRRDYDGAAAAELVTQMQANLERRQRQQYVFNTYGWPSSFDSFTGINDMGHGGGGVGMGQLLEFTEDIPDSSVKVGPLGNFTVQSQTINFEGLLDGKPDPSSWNFKPVGPGKAYQVAGVTGISFTYFYFGENEKGQTEFGFAKIVIRPLYFEYPFKRKNKDIISAMFAAITMAGYTEAAIKLTEKAYSKTVPTEMTIEETNRFFINVLRKFVESSGGRLTTTPQYGNTSLTPYKTL